LGFVETLLDAEKPKQTLPYIHLYCICNVIYIEKL